MSIACSGAFHKQKHTHEGGGAPHGACACMLMSIASCGGFHKQAFRTRGSNRIGLDVSRLLNLMYGILMHSCMCGEQFSYGGVSFIFKGACKGWAVAVGRRTGARNGRSLVRGAVLIGTFSPPYCNPLPTRPRGSSSEPSRSRPWPSGHSGGRQGRPRGRLVVAPNGSLAPPKCEVQ